MKVFSFVVFVLYLMITLLIIEIVMQHIFNVIPVSFSLYPKDIVNLTFWLIPVLSMVVLVFAFIFMVFPFKPKGRDYYREDNS